MSKWEKKKLGEIATFVNGYAFKPDDWDTVGLPIIRIQNLTESSKEINYYNRTYNPKYEVNDGDILVSWSASLGVYKWNKGKAVLNQHIFKVVFDKISIDKDYFVYAVKFLLDTMLKETHGSTMKHITKSRFDNVEFPLPPLETQKQIAKTLDTAAELLAMRKKQLAELDNIIKSVFYDMFGDPVANEKGWNLRPIGDFTIVKIGPFGSLLHVEDYIRGGFPLVNPSHIMDSKIIPDMNLTLSSDKFEELRSYHLAKGDIVVGRRGEIGRCAVVNDVGLLCGTGSMFIRIKKDYLPSVLQRVVSCDTMRAKLEHQSVGVTMKNLNAGTISNLEVPMLPLYLQTQFASIVTKIEEQKALVQKTIDETQYLFDSLMSEYFD